MIEHLLIKAAQQFSPYASTSTPTSASYSHSWLPLMWWHLSMITGPFSLDTSKHKSSVRISLSAVYENTCKTKCCIGSKNQYFSILHEKYNLICFKLTNGSMLHRPLTGTTSGGNLYTLPEQPRPRN